MSADPRHLLVVGAGPGLGAAVARRFTREGCRVTLIARSEPAVAQELRDAGFDISVVRADAGDAAGLRRALGPVFARADGPDVVIYSAALAVFDDLLEVSAEELAEAYAVDVIGAVLTAQLAVPAMRAAGGGTLLFTGGGFADFLPEGFATLSLGKVALRAAGTMLARQVRDDGIHAGSMTILGQIAPGTPFDPDATADAYWAIVNEPRDAWQEEYRFQGATQVA